DLSRLLQAAKSIHGLGSGSGGTLLSGGVINHNFRVAARDGDYVIRVYPPGRRERQVALEISILQHLTRSKCRVPRVISPRPGDPVPLVEGRCSVLLEHLPARPLTFEQGAAISVDRLLSLLEPIDRALDT